MFKREDILPLILAFVSTVLIVILGFSWLSKSGATSFGLFSDNSPQAKGNRDSSPDLLTTNATEVQSNLSSSKVAANNSQQNFTLPVIVPQGTSVAINGSAKLNKINQALRKSFHQQYPGTIISTGGDGSVAGLELLYSREIDLAALDRPLSQAETEAGLTAVAIYNDSSNAADPHMYYVYQEPLSPDAEAFLGYVFSKKGQQAIGQF